MTLTEPQPDDTGAKPVPQQAPKSRKTLSQLKRELSPEELSSSGVQKMLIENLERLDDENTEFRAFRNKFEDADKQLAVLQAKQKVRIGAEIITGACLAIGAAALGYAPSVWSSQPTGWIFICFGGILTILGIIAKAVIL